MNTFIEILGSCMDYIYKVAISISETFTGADSAAVLVMIIFYLVVLISILLLTKLLFRMIRNIFTKKSAAPAVSQPVPEQNGAGRHEIITKLETFNGQALLDRLSTEYNKINETTPAIDEHEQIQDTLPGALPVSSVTGKEPLTEEQLAVLTSSIEGKGLDALQQLLNQTKKRETQLSFELSKITTQLTECRQSRASLVEEEKGIYAKYNAGVGERDNLAHNLSSEKEQLSFDYFKIFNQISAFNDQCASLLEGLKQAEGLIVSLPEMVETFTSSCQSNLQDVSLELQKKEETLNALKGSYQAIRESRVKTDEKIFSLEAEQINLEKEKVPCAELISLLLTKIQELEKEVSDRLAAEYADQQAKEEQARQEKEAILAQAKAAALRAAKENEDVSPKSYQSSPTEARPSSSELDSLKMTLQGQGSGYYALNFDDISPEQLEQIVAAMNRTKKLREEEINQSSGVSPSNSLVEEDAAPAAITEPEPPQVDHFAELQKEWAAERAHKEEWAAEQAQKAADAEDRRRALSGEHGKPAGSGGKQ